MANTNTGPRTALLSIKQASQLLGVSEPTLRHWTDEGDIHAFITPGGHRRYAESDLQGLVRKKQGRQPREQIAAALKEIMPLERQLAEEYLHSTRWYPRLGDNARQELRERGGRMLELIIRYVTRPSQREHAHQEAAEIGREYGLQLLSLGLTMGEATEAFVIHRMPLMDVACRLTKGRGALSKRTQEALLQVSNLTDQALLSLVKVYHESERPRARVVAAKAVG